MTFLEVELRALQQRISALGAQNVSVGVVPLGHNLGQTRYPALM